MPVVKADYAKTLLKEAIVLDLGDIRKQAQALKAAAEASAQKIISEAQAKSRELIAHAHEEGLNKGREEGAQQGYADGLEKGRAEAIAQASQQLKQVAELWKQAAADLETYRHDLDLQARQAVLQFAFRMAEKLVHRVVEVDDTVIIDQVAMALSHVLHPVDVSVRIHPDDRAICDTAMPELLADFAHFKHIQLVDDPSVSVGGCVVNYGQGSIDARIETQLQRIVQAMLPDGMEIAEEQSTDVVPNDAQSELSGPPSDMPQQVVDDADVVSEEFPVDDFDDDDMTSYDDDQV